MDWFDIVKRKIVKYEILASLAEHKSESWAPRDPHRRLQKAPKPPQRAPNGPQGPPGEGPTRAKKGPRAIAPNYAQGLITVVMMAGTRVAARSLYPAERN